MFLELFHPIAGVTAGQAGTITLEGGDVISIMAVAATEGVFVQVVPAAGETCALCETTCDKFVNAVVSFA